MSWVHAAVHRDGYVVNDIVFRALLTLKPGMQARQQIANPAGPMLNFILWTHLAPDLSVAVGASGVTHLHPKICIESTRSEPSTRTIAKATRNHVTPNSFPLADLPMVKLQHWCSEASKVLAKVFNKGRWRDYS